MSHQIAIFLGSLIAVALLVALAHALGFSAGKGLASEAEAREALSLAPGGFAPLAIALDAAGRGALARDASGKLAVLIPHGGRFVARVLGPSAEIRADGRALTICAPELGSRRLVLQVGDGASHWARSSQLAR